MKFKFLPSLFVIFTFSSCNNTYKGNAQNIKLKLEELNNKNNCAFFLVHCDSIEIIVLSNPTLMKLEYDTVIEQTIDEQDFIIIEYNHGNRLLQRVEADDYKYQNLHFDHFKFKKNDTIWIQRFNCDDDDEKWKCEIDFGKSKRKNL
jgi:hypothetical protein